jgi:hypothetical protein
MEESVRLLAAVLVGVVVVIGGVAVAGNGGASPANAALPGESAGPGPGAAPNSDIRGRQIAVSAGDKAKSEPDEAEINIFRDLKDLRCSTSSALIMATARSMRRT